MLHYDLFTWKGNCYSFTDVFVAITINIHHKISFHVECFKNSLPFSSIPFTIPGAQLKEVGYWKIVFFDSGIYLSMWVTFHVFICKQDDQAEDSLKKEWLTVRIRWLIWKLEHLVNTLWLAILMITVCWGNWNVSPQAGTFHMTCTVISYEITLEKCICVSRTIVSTVPPSDKN